MQAEINIKNNADVCTIDIEGTIGVPEEWQFDEPSSRIATYEKFRDTIRSIEQIDAAQIVVNIRSTGGDVNDAILIYEALGSLKAHITTRCYGYTASAATIIAQAASDGARQLSANVLYLIHNSICSTEGNVEELEAGADLLRKTDARLAEIYASRSGCEAAAFNSLMCENNGNGRWLTAEEAITLGLADTVIENPQIKKEPSRTQNIVRKWESFLSRVGIGHAVEQLPSDVNIMSLKTPSSASVGQQSLIALQDAQQRITPTATKPKEDPSINQVTHTVNQRAYADDARRFAK